MVTLTMHPVKSSNVREIGYDPVQWDLYVRFKSGPYVYFRVPRNVFQQLQDVSQRGESIGKFLNEVIKPGYQYKKLHRLVSALNVEVADTVHVAEVGRVMWVGA